MSIHRRAAKSDSTRKEIVAGLRAAGVQVWDIRQPCDLLCRLWSNALQRFVWQPLELKTPEGKRGQVWARKRAATQTAFLADTQTPVVTSLSTALSALGITTAPAPTSPSCSSTPRTAITSSAADP